MARTVVNPIDLASLAGGAIAERFNVELGKVLENIADPNTDPKKGRTLTVSSLLKQMMKGTSPMFPSKQKRRWHQPKHWKLSLFWTETVWVM